jgi:hypothetical protein
VIVLMDANLSSPALTARLNAESEQYGCSFRVLPQHARRFDDDELPEVCQSEGAVALLTNNRHDSSVEVTLYQALIEADVSAVVLRMPNSRTERPDLDWLTARVLKHLPRIIRDLENADQSLLLTVRKDRVKTNPVAELLRNRLA